MESNYIIDPSDRRYGKLGHIWKKYNWIEGNLYRYFDGYQSVFYYIPPELLISEYGTDKIDISVNPKIGFERANWISNRCSGIIEEVTGLTLQEFFDIVVLKINNRCNRPRCSNILCKVPLSWSGRFSHGYYGDTYWSIRPYHYCSTSCRTQMMRIDKDYYKSFNETQIDNIKYILTPYSSIKSAWRRFLNRGNLSDECYFYVARTQSNKFKFGITQEDLDIRSYQEAWQGEGIYKSIKPIYLRSRRFVTNLEALIKLKFDGSEYLEDADIPNFYKYLIKFHQLVLDQNYEFDQLVDISTSTTIS